MIGTRSQAGQPGDPAPWQGRSATALLAGLFLARLVSLGLYPLMDKSESRYAEVGRLMAATGNWITPQLSEGLPFLGKPPLSFWMTASSFELFGVGELTARLPSLLAAAATVALLHRLGCELRGRSFGLLCAVVLATTLLFTALAGTVLTDPALTLSVTLSMVGAAMAIRADAPAARLRWGLAFFAGLALSLLAKGPVGWLLTLLPLGAWAIGWRQWRTLRRVLPWGWGTALTVALALPWYVAAEHATPGFLEYYLVGEHFQRFFVPGWEGDLYGSGHAHPLGMIWLYGLAATLPWCIPALGALIRLGPRDLAAEDDRPWLAYGLLWMLAPLLIFTPARNILVTYVMPGLPGFALAASFLLTRLGERHPSAPAPWPLRRGVLLVSSLLAPTLVLASVPVLRSIARDRCQKAVVERFEDLAGFEQAELHFFGELRSSGAFYSAGRARQIPHENLRALEQVLGGTGNGVVVAQSHDMARVPPELRAQIEELDRVGRYVLLRTRTQGKSRARQLGAQR
ncbi:MAG: glycosyltransferase family 39 protein [Deltaproteobacteria bacterium]|nr:glycosyltransferase family 39 protein [Deltaproteobacteria bacterium]MBW2419691.1 glycosyltransferase family 39 protein [Deltaproteobacteria bacterium]